MLKITGGNGYPRIAFHAPKLKRIQCVLSQRHRKVEARARLRPRLDPLASVGKPEAGAQRVNDYEIRRVIDFIDHTRRMYSDRVAQTEPDASWNIVSYVIKRNIVGHAATFSALVSASGLPYATASRHIHKLIRTGMLIKHIEKPDSSRFTLHPSPDLLARFNHYAQSVKLELARIFGDLGSNEDYPYFLGGEHQSYALDQDDYRRIKDIQGVEHVRFLFHDNFFFLSVRHIWSDFRKKIGPASQFDLCDMATLHARILENADATESAFDVIAIAQPWMQDLIERRAIQPLASLTRRATRTTASADDPTQWHACGQCSGDSYGAPMYATIDLLALRKDWFVESGWQPPDTLEDILLSARKFHAPSRGRYGLVWNAARGRPLAHSFLLFAHRFHAESTAGRGAAGACAAPLDELLQSDAAARALDFMRRALHVSAPDLLEHSDETATLSFMQGGIALAIASSMHASRFELDMRSSVKRRVSYFAVPGSHPRSAAPTPVSGFLLAIPANLPRERAAVASAVLAWLASPEAMRSRTVAGLPISPFFNFTRDPEATALAPLYALVERLRKNRMLCAPAEEAGASEGTFENALGNDIHDALSGRRSDQAVLESARARLKQPHRMRRGT